MVDVSALNDNCFVVATAAIVDVCEAVKDETGSLPTLENLCEILAWGFRGCSGDILEDVNPADVKQVICKTSGRKKVKLCPGDVVAVPAPYGDYYLGVFITSNRFGHAYGFFRDTWPLRPVGKMADMAPIGRAIYSGDRAVLSGTWPILGNYPDLLKLFDDNPERYHIKAYNLDDDAIGPFGAAETADDQLRQVGEEEAAEVGLLDRSYRGVILEEYVAEYLEEKGGRKI